MEQPVYRICLVTIFKGTLEELGFVDDSGNAESRMLEWARERGAVVEKLGCDDWENLSHATGR